MEKDKLSLPQRIDNINNVTFLGTVFIALSGIVGFFALTPGLGLFGWLFVFESFFIGLILVAIGTTYKGNK